MTTSNRILIHHLLLALTAALWAVAAAFQLGGQYPGHPVVFFVFFSTLFTYRIAASNPEIRFSGKFLHFHHPSLKWPLIISLSGIIITAFLLPEPVLIAAIPAAILSFLYFTTTAGIPALRKIPLVKNIVLAAAWSAGTVLIPLAGLVKASDIFLFALARFVYVLALAVAVDLRDMEPDRKHGIRTIPVLFGFDKGKRICIILLILFVTLIWLEFANIPYHSAARHAILTASGILTILSVLALRKTDPPFRFSLFIDGNFLLQAFALSIAAMA